MNSIRRQLLLWLIGALLATGLLASLITYSLAWSAFHRLRDYGLEQIAYSIARHGVEYASAEDEAAAAEMGQFVSQIWNADGSLAYTSLDTGGPPPQPPGLHAIQWHGEEWHVFTLRDRGLTIQVGNPATRRVRLFGEIFPWLLAPLSLLILGLGSIIWMSVSRALSPLESLRREIGRQDTAHLSPLETPNLPMEVAPLAQALNDLLARLDTVLSTQRQFVADAAHELRSPLTALRLQAQVARQAMGDAERQEALAQLMAGVDRASHLVDQMLRMARLEPDARRPKPAAVRLDELARLAVADFSTLADSLGIDLGAGNCDPASVMGDAESLAMMLANLVDNALRYSPAGSRVDVEVHGEADTAWLVVRDQGPGIPPSERERVFDRFHRLADARIPGSGLGLSIVRRVAELHGGQVILEDTPGGGLTARVALASRLPGCPTPLS